MSLNDQGAGRLDEALATHRVSGPGQPRVLAWEEFTPSLYTATQVQSSTVQNSTVQCSTVQYSTVQCSTVQYSIVQYSYSVV